MRREKGPCFTCDEKYFFGHKCPNKQMLLLQMEEDEEQELSPHNPDPGGSSAEETPKDYQPQLSYNALNGTNRVTIMRFEGSLHGKPIQVLVDSGSSDNFLQPRLAQFLKLAIEPSPEFKVMVGNGDFITAEGRIPNLSVNIQGHEFYLPVYLVPVSGADLVLGGSWLATLGTYMANHTDMFIRFYWESKLITLHGLKPSKPTAAQFHHCNNQV